MPGVTVQVDHFVFSNRQQTWVVSWKIDVAIPVEGFGAGQSQPFDNKAEALGVAEYLSKFFEAPYTVCPTEYC
jgi:hypothetical protein